MTIYGNRPPCNNRLRSIPSIVRANLIVRELAHLQPTMRVYRSVLHTISHAASNKKTGNQYNTGAETQVSVPVLY